MLAGGLALAADVPCGGGYCEGTTGDDAMYGKDGEKDTVNCGRGPEDVAFFDRGIDEVRNCEIRNPPVG